MKFKNNFKRFFTLDRHHDAGFTLVELIVVIAILAILAGVAVPMYSGYIKKAEKAGDLQLLGAVNTAFGAAAIENNLAPNELVGTTIPLSAGKLGNMTLMVNDAAADTALQAEMQKDFEAYFANEEAVFKTAQTGKLTYTKNEEKGTLGFELPESGAKSVTTILSGIKNQVTSQIAAVNNSIFGELGAETMMNKVDDVTNMAAGFAGDNESMRTLLTNNKDSLAKLMGYTGADDTAFQTYYKALVDQKYKEMYPDDDPRRPNATNRGNAENTILSNFAVMAAAKSTAGKTAADLMPTLQAGITTSDIKNMLSKGDGAQEALTNSAMMYAMYTAYANGLDDSDPNKATALANAGSVSSVATAISTDTGFQDYLNGTGAWAPAEGQQSQATKDLEGYLGAMEIINKSATTDNKSTVENLIMNGYASDDMLTALEDLLG